MKVGLTTAALVTAQAALSATANGAFVTPLKPSLTRVSGNSIASFRDAGTSRYSDNITPLFSAANEGGEPSSHLEALITPRVNREDALERQEWLMDAVEANPFLELSMIKEKEVDLLTLLQNQRDAASFKQTPSKHYGISVNYGGEKAAPKTVLQIGPDTYKAITEKVTMVYNQGSTAELIDELGLSEHIDVHAEKPFTAQFETSLGKPLGAYQKEFTLGLCHGIDPNNSALCAAKSAWERGALIMTPQIAESMKLDPELLDQWADLGERFEFSDENRGVMIPAKSFFQYGSDDRLKIKDSIVSAKMNDKLEGPLKVARYLDELMFPEPVSIDGHLARRVLDQESHDRLWPAWQSTAETLKSVSAEQWPFPPSFKI